MATPGGAFMVILSEKARILLATLHHSVHVPETNIQQITFFASTTLTPYCYTERFSQNQNHSQRENMHSKAQNLKKRVALAKNRP